MTATVDELTTALSVAEVDATSTFEHDGILCAILSWTSLRDAGAAAMVATNWAAAVRSDGLLWRALFLREFGGFIEPAHAKAACKRCTLAIARVGMPEVATGSAASGVKPRAGAAAGVLGSYVAINGGATTGYNFARTFDVWDPSSRTFVQCSHKDAPQQPFGQVLEELADTEGVEISVAHVRDLSRRWQHSAVPTARGALILYGGKEADTHLTLSCVHMIVEMSNPWPAPILGRRQTQKTINVWSTKLAPGSPPAPARCGHTACRAVVPGLPAAPVRDSSGVAASRPTGPPACMLVFAGEAQHPTSYRRGVMTNDLWALLDVDTATLHVTWAEVESSGARPSARYCHSAELLPPAANFGGGGGEDAPPPRAWLIFGGWNKHDGLPEPGELGAAAPFNHAGAQAFFNDLHRLDLATLAWAAVETRGAVPRRRSQALAVATDDEQLLIVFGGACHSEPEPGQAYGDMVVDLDDVCLLHLPTATWLPPRAVDPPTNRRQRGGLNTLVRHPATRSLHVFGGMNSEEGQDMPNFLSTMTELVGVQAD